MAPGQFVMAADAGFGSMAQGARSPVVSGILAMNIVLPAYGMGGRPHDLVTTDALISTGHGGLYRRVAHETFGARQRSFRLVMAPKALGVEVRLYEASMACGR